MFSQVLVEQKTTKQFKLGQIKTNQNVLQCFIVKYMEGRSKTDTHENRLNFFKI